MRCKTLHFRKKSHIFCDKLKEKDSFWEINISKFCRLCQIMLLLYFNLLCNTEVGKLRGPKTHSRSVSSIWILGYLKLCNQFPKISDCVRTVCNCVNLYIFWNLLFVSNKLSNYSVNSHIFHNPSRVFKIMWNRGTNKYSLYKIIINGMQVQICKKIPNKVKRKDEQKGFNFN